MRYFYRKQDCLLPPILLAFFLIFSQVYCSLAKENQNSKDYTQTYLYTYHSTPVSLLYSNLKSMNIFISMGQEINIQIFAFLVASHFRTWDIMALYNFLYFVDLSNACLFVIPLIPRSDINLSPRSEGHSLLLFSAPFFSMPCEYQILQAILPHYILEISTAFSDSKYKWPTCFLFSLKVSPYLMFSPLYYHLLQNQVAVD